MVVYTLILLVFVLTIIKMFRKIEIDPISIMFSLIPFIFLGSSTRALVDNGIFPKTVFLITPGLYILVGLATIASLLFSVFLYNRKNLDYRITLFLIGIVLIIPNLFFIPHVNLVPIFYVLAIWIFTTLIFFALSNALYLFHFSLKSLSFFLCFLKLFMGICISNLIN